MKLSFSQGLAIPGSLIVALFFFFPVGGLDQQTSQIAALTIFLVIFWATNVLPPYLTVLIYFGLAMLFNVLPAEVVFSGFSSGAFWLVFGGLVIGAAVKETGFANRIAGVIAGYFGKSYRGLIAGLILLGVFLSFLMPSSMGRIVLLVPIALALVERFQFDVGTPGRYGILLAIIFGAHQSSFAIMPANVPNLVLIGTLESVWDLSVSYGTYFFYHFPVLGLLKAILVYTLIIFMFPAQLPASAEEEKTKREPMSAAEKRLAIIMAGVLTLWATDFIHGIAPSWIALAAGVILLLPVSGILKPDAFNKQISFSSLFFVAGIISLGTMIAQSELSVIFGEWIGSALPLSPGADFLNFMVISITAMISSLIGTVATVPAVLVPLSDILAATSGLPLLNVSLIYVTGFSTVFFPYQAAPLLVGVLLAKIPAGLAMRFTLALGFLSAIVLIPLDYVWLSLIGFFG